MTDLATTNLGSPSSRVSAKGGVKKALVAPWLDISNSRVRSHPTEPVLRVAAKGKS